MKYTDQKKKNYAFSLIEILVTIGIISILAAVVLVSMSGQASKARSAKALASLSSAIPSMYSCWSNRGDVNQPVDSGGDICSINASYGKWPSANTGDLASYSYSSTGSSGIVPNGNWYVRLKSGSDEKTICCNSTIKNCESVEYVAGSGDCAYNIPSD